MAILHSIDSFLLGYITLLLLILYGLHDSAGCKHAEYKPASSAATSVSTLEALDVVEACHCDVLRCRI
jgi:hypothetical protein